MNVAYKSYSIESEILRFGLEVFAEIGKAQPSTLNKNYWSTRIMNWSMNRPDFKFNMFRLVDVLPTLRSGAEIAEHVKEYLAEPAANIHPLLGWLLRGGASSLRGRFGALFVNKSVEQMAQQFIAGKDAKQGLPALREMRRGRMAFTVDLLGEYSLSTPEADAYFNRYAEALTVLGREVPRWDAAAPILPGHPGEISPVCVSVKLSALYSQCGPLNFDKSVQVLSQKLAALTALAQENQALLYVDAEDTANNPIIYAAFKNVFGSREFRDFPFPGIVVQAYARNSRQTLEDLLDFAKRRQNPIAVRLVKGAYWDSETIMAAQQGLETPLWSKKESSDANYEALSRLLIDNRNICLPAFASHNIRSLAHACCYAESKGLGPKDIELQMLFGMAEPIARAFSKFGYLVRLYVPLGETLPGMGYLVRRLLENTSNESFLRHTFFDSDDAAGLLKEPRLYEE